MPSATLGSRHSTRRSVPVNLRRGLAVRWESVLAFKRQHDYTSSPMTFERRLRAPLSKLWQTAICLLAVVQVVLAFASTLEGRYGADAKTHIEAAGTSVHHAHNPADCAACAARGLMAAANRSDNTVIESRHGVALVTPKRGDHLAEFLKGSTSRPRAPPIRHA